MVPQQRRHRGHDLPTGHLARPRCAMLRCKDEIGTSGKGIRIGARPDASRGTPFAAGGAFNAAGTTDPEAICPEVLRVRCAAGCGVLFHVRRELVLRVREPRPEDARRRCDISH